MRVLDADLPRSDRRRVVYEGIYTRGFEVSRVGDVWLGFTDDATFVGQPSGKKENGRAVDRVRMTGTLFARPDHRYGHLAGGRYFLIASKLEYLDW